MMVISLAFPLVMNNAAGKRVTAPAVMPWDYGYPLPLLALAVLMRVAPRQSSRVIEYP